MKELTKIRNINKKLPFNFSYVYMEKWDVTGDAYIFTIDDEFRMKRKDEIKGLIDPARRQSIKPLIS
jgi:hypothetical protein